MKTISLRSFQLKPSKFLSELPITLTKYNRPFAVVTTFQMSNVNKTNSVVEKSIANGIEKPLSEAPTTPQPQINTPTKTFIKCSVSFCNEEATGTGKVYDDGEWVSKPMCNKHIISSLKEYLKAT